jgi:hypothetical protein
MVLQGPAQGDSGRETEPGRGGREEWALASCLYLDLDYETCEPQIFAKSFPFTKEKI